MIKTRWLFLAFLSYLLVFSTTVFAQPTITEQPTNQSAAVGQTATFNITATSANPISYQWYKDAAVISGAILNSYTTPATTLGDNGTVYYCTATDLDGSVQSNNATLLVGEAPVITQDPQDVTVTEGEGATFTVSATGTAPLQYQWRKNGVDIVGANTSAYNIATTTVSENGDIYSSVVSNSFGLVLSNNATLTVNAGVSPVISEQSQDQSVLNGQAATFTVVASGTTPLQYQWKKNDVDIAGANSTSYTTPSTILSDDQTIFYCVITNSFGTVNSDEATLFVTDASSRVTGGLQVLYEFEDGSGDLIHDVSGNVDPEDIKIITPENTAWTPTGLETFFGSTTRREVTDSKIRANCIASNEITLEVWIQPEFVFQSSRRIFTYSLSASFRNFSIISEGDHYEFRLLTDSTDLNGFPAISSSAGTQKLELTHLVYTRGNDGTAKVFVNGVLDTEGNVPGSLSRFKDNHWLAIGSEPLGGSEWRGMHYLAAVYDRALTDFEVQHNYSIGTPVDNIPAYTIHPTDQYILEGESLLLDSYAVSVLPLTYQWRKNGVSIPGETDRKLNLSNVGALDNGAVFVSVATTSAGTTISNSATVYVTALDDRVNTGVQVLYTFGEGTGNVVNDVSGVGAPLNLNIFSADAVQWESNGLRINTSPSIVTTNSATKIIVPVKSSSEISIEAWLSSANVNQTSPARIFTISADGTSRNFSLGQNNDSYEVNLRTTATDNNGSPATNSSAGTVSASGFDHVVFTRATDGTAKFYINGTERVSTTVGGDLSNWNDVYLLSLGNEFGVDHHWEGLLNLVAVFDRSLTNSEVLRNYNFGAYGVVYQPTNLSLISNEIGKITFSWSDNSTNEDGFLIERGVGDPVVYSQIGSVGKDSTTFVDENIVDNTIYSYRVKAFYSLGESDYSDSLIVKSLITPVSAPTNLDYITLENGHPELFWNDNSDNEIGFKIERKLATVGAEFSLIDSVLADVTTYEDKAVSDSTTYVYQVYAFSADTVSEFSGEKVVYVITDIEEVDNIPTEYSLSQNYPNPFNPTTTVKFGLPQNSYVTLVLYNLLGQEIIKLVEKDFSAGRHSIVIDAKKLTSGIYIYSISAHGADGNNFVETKKMILLK